MPAFTARKRILAFLERSQAATPNDLARALNITPANARHHLSQLREEGLVRESGLRLPGGRGRPARVYRLNTHAGDESVSFLLAATLDFLDEHMEEAARAEWTDFVAARLAGERLLSPGAHITRRLAAAIDRLNALKYHARWEARAEGPGIILGECPYARIVEAHPVLCYMDAALLARLTGQPVQQVAKLEPDERGLPYCMFLIKT